MSALKSNIFPLFSFFSKRFPSKSKDAFLGLKLSTLVIYSIFYFLQKPFYFLQKAFCIVQKPFCFIQKERCFFQKAFCIIQKPFYVVQKPFCFIQKARCMVQKGRCFYKKHPSINNIYHLFIWKSMNWIHEHSPPPASHS